MPSVNQGPSNTQTQNITAGMVNPANASAVSGGYLIGQTGIPVGIAGTGTMGANGALTLGTALASAFTAGAYLYFPAGAVYSGSTANFYFTKMSSTTLGTVYNNIYIAANGLPQVPSSLVLVSDAGPGAYTGVTTAQTVAQLTIPPNLMGNNGSVQIDAMYTYTNSAGTKTLSMTYGGSTILGSSPTTTSMLYFTRNGFNRGVTNAQIFPASGALTIGSPQAVTAIATSADTTGPVILATTLTVGAATDNAFVEFIRAQAFYSA